MNVCGNSLERVVGCAFCAQARGLREGDVLRVLRGDDGNESSVVAETERFVLFPSIGALVPGHVLVCPRRHARSFATLRPDELREARRFSDWAAAVVEEETGLQAMLFEHGSSSRGRRVACSVEHAHLHVVPLPEGVAAAAVPELEFERFDVDVDLAAHVGEDEYLRIRIDGGWQIATTREGFPSQLMRRQVARALGLAGSWDWRADPRRRNVQATYGWASWCSGAPSGPSGRTSDRVSIQTRAPQLSGASGR